MFSDWGIGKLLADIELVYSTPANTFEGRQHKSSDILTMEINFIDVNGTCIAEIISEVTEIKNAQDAVDIMMNCIYQGADGVIITKQNVIADFFDLKTGLAGDILQKFSTYNARLAIVGDFENIASKSLRDFIYESNKIRRINFVSSRDLAVEVLSR